jgi:hypothetical protein
MCVLNLQPRRTMLNLPANLQPREGEKPTKAAEKYAASPTVVSVFEFARAIAQFLWLGTNPSSPPPWTDSHAVNVNVLGHIDCFSTDKIGTFATDTGHLNREPKQGKCDSLSIELAPFLHPKVSSFSLFFFFFFFFLSSPALKSVSDASGNCLHSLFFLGQPRTYDSINEGHQEAARSYLWFE